MRRGIRRVLRGVGWSMLGLLAVFAGLCTVGELRQRVLAHRTKALMVDIQSLEDHKSTWADAQRLMTKWGKWGHWEGSCTAADCMYVVTLENGTIGENHNVATWTWTLIDRFRLLPRQWGGGLRQLQGMFLVQDGLVRRRGLSLDMTVSLLAKNAEQPCCGYELLIAVTERSELRGLWQPLDSLARHPSYTVARPGGCSFCLMGRVTLAVADSGQFSTLSNFQISCATRWSSCLTLEQLDPAATAWHLYGPPWGEAPEPAEFDAAVQCRIPVAAIARDAESVVEVEAHSDSTTASNSQDGMFVYKTSLQMTRLVAGTTVLRPGVPTEVPFSAPKANSIRPMMRGQRYLILVSEDEYQEPGTVASCGVAPLDEASRAEVERGLRMRDPIRGREPSASLSGFWR